MRLLVFFDYVFYNIAYFYANHLNYNDIKVYAGAGILCLLQLSNGLFILFLIKPFDELTDIEKLFAFLIGYLIIFGLNLYRYKKIKPYEELEEDWKGENQKKRGMKMLMIICYVLLSILLLGVHRKFV